MSNNELIIIKSVEDGYYLEFLTEEGKEASFTFTCLDAAKDLEINGYYEITKDKEVELCKRVTIIEKGVTRTDVVRGKFETIAATAKLFASFNRKIIIEEVERYLLVHQDYGIVHMGAVVKRKEII